MHKTSFWWWVGLIVLLVGAFAWRCQAVVELDGKPWLDDPDTVHRLARLEALRTAERYPLVDLREGFPRATESHWTRPMDWVIQGLDPIGKIVWPAARGYEAGALLAGPTLAMLTTWLVVWFGRRLFSPIAGLVAGVLYAASYSTISVSWLGNGDHQTLQNLAAVGAFGSFTVALARPGSVRPALGAGAWLGLSVWVSAESMLLVYLMAFVVFGLAWRERGGGAGLRRVFQAACTGLLGVVGFATFFEQRHDPWRLVWDSVSMFHVWQVLVLTTFSLLLAWPLRGWRRALVAALLGIAIGLVPMLFEPLRLAVLTSLHQVSGADLWGKNEVSEYRSALWNGYGFSFWKLVERFSWFPFALPVCVVLCWRSHAWPKAMQFALALFAFGTLGLAVHEVKLAHLHAAPAAWLLVAGVRAVHLGPSPRFAALRKSFGWIVGLLAVFALARAQPVPPGMDSDGRRRVLAELCATVDRLVIAKPGGSVLAPWSQGAHLHYATSANVVASGYHRNLEGIKDSHRSFLAKAIDEPTWRPILAARQVSLVVVWPDRYFFATAPKVLGDPTEFVRVTQGKLQMFPPASESLYWVLRSGARRGGSKVPPGFTLAAKSAGEIDVGFGPEPAFTLWRYSP